MSGDLGILTAQNAAHVGTLLVRTGIALGMHDAELAQHLGVSRRSVSRWGKEGTRLTPKQVAILVELVHPRDPSLAAELGALVGQTLVDLGMEKPPPPPSPKLADAVVCVAAEVLDMSPRAVRPALLAAIRCAREVGFSMAALEAALNDSVAQAGATGSG